MVEMRGDNFSQNTKFGRFLKQSWLKRGNSKTIFSFTRLFLCLTDYSKHDINSYDSISPIHIKVVLRAATKMKCLPKVLIKKNSLNINYLIIVLLSSNPHPEEIFWFISFIDNLNCVATLWAEDRKYIKLTQRQKIIYHKTAIWICYWTSLSAILEKYWLTSFAGLCKKKDQDQYSLERTEQDT